MGEYDSMDLLNTRQNPCLGRLFECSVDQYPDNIAIECGDEVLTYQALDLRANQLAHYLMSQGVDESVRVGILLERSIESYIAILAILKTGAAYIPIDIEYPDERINHILNDYPLHAVITSSSQLTRLAIQFPLTIVINELSQVLAQQDCRRPHVNLMDSERLCYVIYTSGTSGKPKGVEITHRSVCHYVTTASALYEMTPRDKVYQGFSLAFDASIEELWMAFANGATLIACTSKDIRSGLGLVDFLNKNCVTVFSTVPTLLASLEDDPLSSLRLLILGGEACLPGLVKRFSRPNLRLMNTYGPTEATVIATCTECSPDKAITIGKPLPGYNILILDEQLQPVVDGQSGELCIGGVGLARGYVNRPEMTAEKFITYPKDSESRFYRTGDLAAFNADGDLVFMGRVDDQVKIRGFRVELGEIESVMMDYAPIQGAVVSLYQDTDRPILAAFILSDKNKPFDLAQLKSFLRQQLPAYMMPDVFECLDEFPLLSSGKVDRKALPKPSMFHHHIDYNPPETQLEKDIAAVFETVLQVSSISITADFFYDLGGHSLLAAKVISTLRQIDILKSMSILDLYNNPSIKQLADKFTKNTAERAPKTAPKNKYHVSGLNYFLCGVGQLFGCLFQYAIQVWQLLLIVLCYKSFNYDNNGFSIASVMMSLGLFFGLPIATMLLTVALKWILLGRVKPGHYKLWGWFYLRWWFIDRLTHFVFSPKLLKGTVLINIYYRLMGAKIGVNCYIGTNSIASFDNLTIRDNTSVGYDVRLLGYQVDDGWLKIGTITIGQDCFIGARSFIAPNTVIHDGAVLDSLTMLSTDTIVPSNTFFHGSPARQGDLPQGHITKQVYSRHETITSYETVYFGFLYYLSLLFVNALHYLSYVPGFILIAYIISETQTFSSILFAAPLGAIVSMGLYYLSIIVLKKIFINQTASGLYALNSFYYLRHVVLMKLLDMPEVGVLADSLYFPFLLRLMGSKLGKRVEIGETPSIIPGLVSIGEEAFMASSVAMAWPSIYQGMVQFESLQIGKRTFVGNLGFLPLGAQLGDSVLLGCLTSPPLRSDVVENHTAWLGSPAIFLPKRELFTGYTDKDTLNPPKKLFFARLAIEFIRVILPTALMLIGLFSLLQVIDYLTCHVSLVDTLFVLPFIEVGIVLALVASLILFKWIVLGRLKPTVKPLWNILIRKIDLIEYSWSYFITPNLSEVILGTPFISILLRCLGASIGKKNYIGTEGFAEFDLISIGSHVCINPETLIDTHLYEDRIFKLSTIDIHDGCNVGAGSVVLYDTVMEENSSLGDLSLLMKGERLLANTRWQGVPAQSYVLVEPKVDLSAISDVEPLAYANEVIT